jgi:flagellar basal body-associated protein FliL
MSEQAKEAPEGKKKKGKLPMIIILAVVLGGGGFFGMKMRGGDGKKKEPEIKLGAVVEIKDEFLTNMADRNSYVRAKISLQVKDGFDKAKVEHDLAPIQDVINMKLQATSLRSVSTLDGMRKLKKELAAEVNKLLAEHEEKKKDEDKDAEPNS